MEMCHIYTKMGVLVCIDMKERECLRDRTLSEYSVWARFWEYREKEEKIPTRQEFTV